MKIDANQSLLEVGGKAFQLYRLRELHNVPPFFTLSFDDPEEIDLPTVQEEILERCKKKGFYSMAVRSSAPDEDAESASFAGIFETVLNVGPDHLIAAIRKVLASPGAPRVAQYLDAFGLGKISKINVIVQQMVKSRVAGVCLTRSHDDSEVLIIEACFGLGETLVSGKVTPDTYRVSRGNLSLEREQIGYQFWMLPAQSYPSGEIEYVEVPFHKRNARKLTKNEIREVAAAALRIERELGFNAADVEWAIADKLYILQARPEMTII